MIHLFRRNAQHSHTDLIARTGTLYNAFNSEIENDGGSVRGVIDFSGDIGTTHQDSEMVKKYCTWNRRIFWMACWSNEENSV